MYLIELNGQAFLVLESGAEYTLGSSKEQADWVLEDDSVAPAHATLSYANGSWWIDDLESHDGTYVCGSELTPGHKKQLHDGDRIGLGLKEYVLSVRPPLFVSHIEIPTASDALSLALSSTPDVSSMPLTLSCEQWLLLFGQLTQLLKSSSDTGSFIDAFLDTVGQLFEPERVVFAFEDELYTRGCTQDDALATLILNQARFQMKTLAFVEQDQIEQPKGQISAFYAPISIDELIRGYIYILSPKGHEWNAETYTLFERLAEFASQGVTSFQELRRAHEDREVLHLNLVGVAPEMQRLKTDLLRFAQNDLPILIYGEEGVGKSRIARAIHQASGRKQSPLLVLNAAHFPKELFEVELCGSITTNTEGILRTRVGKIDLAEGGTFLIESLDALPLGIQPTLLALLKSGQYTRVGGEEVRRANVRMLFTSSVPIRELLQSEKLIPELASLLMSNTLQVPSLRYRQEDVGQLFRAFLGRFGEEEGLPTCVVSEAALLHLKNHRWTYNIRELRDIVARCFYELDPEHPVVDEALIVRVLEAHTASCAKEHPDVLGSKVMALEHQLIQEALMAANDDLQEAAKALGISRVVLWRKMRALAIG